MIKNVPGYQIVVFVGVIIIIGMTIYPPWRLSIQLSNGPMSQPYGWAYLFNPPDAPVRVDAGSSDDFAAINERMRRNLFPESYKHEHPWAGRVCSVSIDWPLLLLEYFIVLLPAGALAAFFYIAAKRKREE